MKRLAATVLAVALAQPLAAQTVSSAPGGQIRVLDKLNGTITDLELRNGEPQTAGLLTVTLNECRYPAQNPSGDAFAELTVTYRDETPPAFEGWMIASSPALNAMDHPRYDVWVLRCTV